MGKMLGKEVSDLEREWCEKDRLFKASDVTTLASMRRLQNCLGLPTP